MNETTTRLVAEALNSRGLWIGLHPREPLPQDLPPDSHITIVHIGKDHPTLTAAELAVASALQAAATIAGEFISIEAGVGGVARFRTASKTEGDPLVLLIQHPVIREMRDRALHVLTSLGVGPRKSWDFTPHLTLRRLPLPHADVNIPPVERRTISFDRVSVVCGDARLFHQLGRTVSK